MPQRCADQESIHEMSGQNTYTSPAPAGTNVRCGHTGRAVPLGSGPYTLINWLLSGFLRFTDSLETLRVHRDFVRK